VSESSMEEIARVVVEAVHQSLHDLGREDVHLDRRFHIFDDGGFTSLSFLQLLLSIEQKCGRTFDLNALDFDNIETVDALITQIHKIVQV
jgi:acyl carrier protein